MRYAKGTARDDDFGYRSVFVEWPTLAAARAGVDKLSEGFPTEFVVCAWFQHDDEDEDLATESELVADAKTEVYFGLIATPGSAKEDLFIATAVEAGGEYTGS